MKKVLVMAVAVLVTMGFAVSAMAQDDDVVEIKQKTVDKGDASITTTEVKDMETGASATSKTTIKPESIQTEEKIKGKNVKMEAKKKGTAEGIEGKTKVKVKKGAIKKLSIDYSYYMENGDYVIDYNVKDKVDPDLLKELNLTPEQEALIAPGNHRVVSTSPYTAGDLRDEIRSIILDDIKQAVMKNNSKKKK